MSNPHNRLHELLPKKLDQNHQNLNEEEFLSGHERMGQLGFKPRTNGL